MPLRIPNITYMNIYKLIYYNKYTRTYINNFAAKHNMTGLQYIFLIDNIMILIKIML